MAEDRRRFFIDGAWVDPAGSETLGVENPATEETIAEIGVGTEADIDRAVGAAATAFARWSVTTPSERRAILQAIQDRTRARRKDLAAAISAEMGAPISMAEQLQASGAIRHVDGFLAGLDAIEWEERLGNGDLILREPIGVCGLITPWNWPMNQVSLKVLSVIAAGCTCVLKPSEIAPLSAMLYMDILAEAGVPAGVVNLVNGTGPETGAALSRHADVAMMSFTGSTRGGVAVTHDAAETVKRTTLELGGKSPNLVLADCGEALEKRVRASVAECFLNTGQSCDAPSRMLVERSVYDDVCGIAAAAAEATDVGDPAERGSHLGPLSSRMQWDRVQGYIEGSESEGARLMAGGAGRPDGMNRGHYVRPTIFADVGQEMTIWREEVFGPVLAITPFQDEDEGVALANDTDYGLAAYIQTGDVARGRRLAGRLKAGMVHLNGASMGVGSPFGGYKRSGNGREGGRIGLEEFLEVKTVLGAA